MSEIISAILMLGWSAVPQGVPDPLAPLGLPARIRVYHADPYVLVALLEGRQVPFPEMSTLAVFGFQPGQSGQQGQGFYPQGTFIVNPTDNSIWYLPRR